MLLGIALRKGNNFDLRGYHRLWLSFPGDSTNYFFGNFPAGPNSDPKDPATLSTKRTRAYT